MKKINKRQLILNNLNLVEKKQDNLVMKNPLIEIKDLNVNFNRGSKLFEAIKNINLKIYENDILGIVGESGSGKTTLGRSILGLWSHSSGEVRINGKQVPSKRIKSVNSKNIWVYKLGQMIFQDPTSSLNRQSKVLNIVREGFKNFKQLENESKEKIKSLKDEINFIKVELKTIKNPHFAKKQEEAKIKVNEFKKIIKNSNKPEFKKFIENYSLFIDLNNQLNKIINEENLIKKDISNKLKNIKIKNKSDKTLLKENSENDKDFFNIAMKDELHEFKQMFLRYNKNSKKLEDKIEKRINSFVEFINNELNKLPEKIKNKIGKALIITADKNKILFSINILDNWINKNIKTKDIPSLNLIKNIKINLEILLLKLNKKLSVFNTIEFDFIYKFCDNKLTERINYILALIIDLDKRIEKEKLILKEAKDLYHKEFQDESIKYLNEYKKILIDLIEEYRYSRIEYKNIIKDHEIKGIKNFYKYLNILNKRNNILQLSLISWKSQNRVKYEKRKKQKILRDIKIEKEKIIKKINSIKIEYKKINNLQKILNLILKDEILESYTKINLNKNDFVLKDSLIDKKTKSLQSKINYKKSLIILEKNKYKNKKTKNNITINRIKESLRIVGLSEDFINKYPDQFSGGQKQRIGIARTIITRPKFIIADEPISALDVSVQAQVINLLKDLHKKMGLTMIFIAHDLQMVNYISNKIAVIYRGNIVEYGEANEIYKKPIHPYTKSLIDAMPSLKNVGKKLEASNYRWSDHNYNEFSNVELKRINKNHFVYGTDEEIKRWI